MTWVFDQAVMELKGSLPCMLLYMHPHRLPLYTTAGPGPPSIPDTAHQSSFLINVMHCRSTVGSSMPCMLCMLAPPSSMPIQGHALRLAQQFIALQTPVKQSASAIPAKSNGHRLARKTQISHIQSFNMHGKAK